MSDFAELLRRCEADVRSGRAQKVAEHLLGLEFKSIPRGLRLAFANVCRRANLLGAGLKILGPAVRSDAADASPSELAEYAVLLQRSGATAEALQVLRGVDVRRAPEANLYTAFCLFNIWDYDAAVKPLRDYLRSPLDPYRRLVAQVNLAAALVVTRDLEDAEHCVSENLQLAGALGAKRLEGNCLELLAQIHIQRGELTRARAVLNGAAELLGGEDTLDSLFVRKWLAIADALETGEVEGLETFRAEAERFKDWESVREVDLYRLKIKYDEGLFHRLYFGTPFPRYRERMIHELGRAPGADVHVLGPPGAHSHLDLRTGDARPALSLRPGKKIHQLISALVADLYRPARVCDLFSRLYPDEHYDPFTSPGRVQQILRRARGWLRKESLPLAIRQDEGLYTLVITGDFRLSVDTGDGAPTTWVCMWREAERAFAGRDLFSADSARKALGLSPSGFKRFARWAIETKGLERVGAGKATCYRMPSLTRARAA